MTEPKLGLKVAATFTAEPLEETLRFWARELSLPLEPGFAPYNQLFQQLLDPASLLGANRSGLNVLLLRLEDLGASPAGNAGTALEQAERRLRELLAALKGALARRQVPWLVVLCPASEAALRVASLAGELARLQELAVAALPEGNGLSLLQPAELLRLYPGLSYDDPQANRLGHVPFTPAGYAALATLIVRRSHALWRPPKKVIAVDCDQTLWAGVCAEDGPTRVRLDVGRQALQEFLRRQAESGLLVCLCSKNNEADVAEVFRQRPEMPLGSRHIAAQRINWRPKSENLRALAQELQLGLDSFVLLDDSPVECAEVEANCPEVSVLHLAGQPETWPRFLEHVWAFDRAQLTEEDRQRTARYRESRLREQFQAAAPTLQSFLAGLELQLSIEPAKAEDLARVSQLTQRTNQFNCTTRRRSEEDIAQLHRQAPERMLAVRVSDRFGDYGLVGALLLERAGEALRVDTFLLSCRVLGKGVEHRLLAHLGRLAQQWGAARVDVPFVPTERNQPALDFLRRVGASYEQGENGGSIFRFPAAVAAAVSIETEAGAAPAQKRAAPTGPTPALSGPASHLPAVRHAWVARTAADPEQILLLLEGRDAARIRSPVRTPSPPRTEAEHRLCLVWQEVLRLEQVGIREDFFELGGTSQLAVRLCARIERQLGRKLPLATLFKAPTIEELAVEMGREGERPRQPR